MKTFFKYLVALIATVLVLHFGIGFLERQECGRWAQHPDEVRHQWQYDQCAYHELPLNRY